MTGTLTVKDDRRPGARREDGGRWPRCAHSRDHGAAKAGLVRAARRGRLGLGDGQGDRLADVHHPHPRLHPRPRLLPDGGADGRPGRPGLVADQPLPAREPDAARARRPVGAIVPWAASPTELDLPRRRTDGAVVQLGTQLLYIGGSDGTTAQSTVYVAKTVGTGNFDAWQSGPDAARRADRRECRVRRREHLRHGRQGRERQADQDHLRPDPRQQDRSAH